MKQTRNRCFLNTFFCSSFYYFNQNTYTQKMSNSDSEDFESADEDVEEKQVKTNENILLPTQQRQQEKQKAETPKAELPNTGWRSWGAFTAIGNASKAVASITTQVSQSISTALDSTLNIPDPEQMARLHVEQQNQAPASEESPDPCYEKSRAAKSEVFKLDNILSNVTQISSKVVSGGLDTLEGIGKKTINILQETDPNIKEKIRVVTAAGKRTNLSELLKEAKERGDQPTVIEKKSEISFELLLDEYKGFVFIEALEILSNQSRLKIDQLMKPLTSGKVLTEMGETLEEVKELCELPDLENYDESLTVGNLESKLEKACEDLTVKPKTNEIVNFAKEIQLFLDQLDEGVDTQIIYEKSIQVIAKICALSLSNMQKLAELLLSLEYRSTADEADALSQLILVYFSLLNHFSTQFSQKLNTEKATSIFLEQENAFVMLKRTFSLFIPILQIGAV